MIVRHTCFLATLCSSVAWAPPPQTAQQPRPCRLRAAQLDADAYPPAPWSFSNARVMYQPTLVRTSAARAVTPRDGLTLLSVSWLDAGWRRRRLDGVTSRAIPRGRRAERVGRAGLSIGAWASHIVVTAPASVGGGRAVFGLPTVLGSVEFKAGEESDNEAWRRELSGARDLLEDIAVAFKVGIGAAQPGIAEPAERLRRRVERVPTTRGFDFASDADVAITGWDGWRGGAPEDGSQPEPPKRTPARQFPQLLRYPLKLGPANRVALRPAMPTRWSGVSDDLAAVLDGPRRAPCIQVDGVFVVPVASVIKVRR